MLKETAAAPRRSANSWREGHYGRSQIVVELHPEPVQAGGELRPEPVQTGREFFPELYESGGEICSKLAHTGGELHPQSRGECLVVECDFFAHDSASFLAHDSANLIEIFLRHGGRGL